MNQYINVNLLGHILAREKDGIAPRASRLKLCPATGLFCARHRARIGNRMDKSGSIPMGGGTHHGQGTWYVGIP